MKFEVLRDKFGIFKDARIMELSAEGWVFIQISLKESLGSEQDSLEYYINRLDDEMERQCDPVQIEDTKKVIDIIKYNISMWEKLIQVFDEPDIMRVEDE